MAKSLSEFCFICKILHFVDPSPVERPRSSWKILRRSCGHFKIIGPVYRMVATSSTSEFHVPMRVGHPRHVCWCRWRTRSVGHKVGCRSFWRRRRRFQPDSNGSWLWMPRTYRPGVEPHSNPGFRGVVDAGCWIGCSCPLVNFPARRRAERRAPATPKQALPETRVTPALALQM